MPSFFEFDPVNGILRGRIEGPVTDQSIKEFYGRAGQYVARVHPRGGLMDFSGVTSFDVSSETIRQLAHQAPALPDPALPRVVIAPSGLTYGLLRMFQAVGGSTRPNLQVVRTQEEAYELLGLQAPRFEPLEEEAADEPAG